MTTETVLPFTGLTVLVTGNIADLTRDEAKAAISALGGVPAAGVSGKVNLVVLGDGAGVSKTAKARSLKIPVIGGDTLLRLTGSLADWDGEPVGMTFAEWDALTEPELDPDHYPSFDPDHRVGKGVGHIRVGDTIQRQVRLSCTCGHRWMRHELWGDDKCPRPEVPVTIGPWNNLTPTT